MNYGANSIAIKANSVSLPESKKVLNLSEIRSWNLTNEIEHFVPRINLIAQIEEKLTGSADDNSLIILSVLRGMGGVGKTTLANYIIHRKECVFKGWFNVKSINNLQDQYIDLGLTCQLYTLKDELSMKVMVERVLRHLEAYPGWILAYDNVGKYEDIKALLPQSGGHIIITSRHHNWPKNTTVDIDVMNEKESVKLVIETTKMQEDAVIVKELVKKLGYLPLAISQACGYITASENMSVARYMDKYNEYEQELLASERMLPGDFHAPVAVTWEINFKEIKMRNTNAADLLNACAFLDGADILEEILLRYLKKRGVSEHQYDEIKMTLLDYCLIKVNEKSISIHRLVQTILRHKIEENANTLYNVKESLLDFFLDEGLEDYEKTMASDKETAERREYLRKLFAHVKAVCGYINYETLTTETKKHYATVLTLLGKWFEWHADYTEVQRLYKQIVKIYRCVYGSDNNADVATSLGNLGNVLLIQGNYVEAQSYHKQTLAIRRGIYNIDNHPDIATSLNNLGNAFYRQGQYIAAQKMYKQALTAFRMVYESDNHRDISMSLTNLGNVFNSLGHYTKAKKLYERALKICKTINDDGNHRDVAACLNNLGNVSKCLDNYAEAEKFYEQALKIYRAIYGSDNHPDVAMSLDNLGGVFNCLGNYPKARRQHEQALAIYRGIYGSNNHIDVAMCLNNLGNTLCNQGDYLEAQGLHEQALEICRKVIGHDNHSAVAQCLSSLGCVFYTQGKYFEAQIQYKQALTICTIIHGSNNHRDVAACLGSLGSVCLEQDDYAQAQIHFEKSLETFRAIYGGDNHPDVTACFNNLGNVFYRQGSYEKGQNYYEKALSIGRKIYGGNNHPIIAQYLNNLGNVFYRQGNYKEGQSYYEEALSIGRTIYSGDNHPIIAQYLNNLGNLFDSRGEHIKATEYYHLAAKQGNAVAQVNLGVYYMTISEILDYQQAYVWFENAYAEGKGQKFAGCHLGILYAYGLAQKKSLAKPLYSYMEAAADGYPLAQILLGIYYVDELITTMGRNDQIAENLFERARVPIGKYRDFNYKGLILFFERLSKEREVSANLLLGVVYEKGLLNINMDKVTAVGYYQKAAVLGSLFAKDKLQKLNTDSQEINRMEKFELYGLIEGIEVFTETMRVGSYSSSRDFSRIPHSSTSFFSFKKEKDHLDAGVHIENIFPASVHDCLPTQLIN